MKKKKKKGNKKDIRISGYNEVKIIPTWAKNYFLTLIFKDDVNVFQQT